MHRFLAVLTLFKYKFYPVGSVNVQQGRPIEMSWYAAIVSKSITVAEPVPPGQSFSQTLGQMMTLKSHFLFERCTYFSLFGLFVDLDLCV